MDLDRLRDGWRQEGDGTMRRPEQEELAMIRARALELDRIVRRRDRLETAVALLLLPLFAWLSVVGRFELSRLGAALIAISCVIIPLRLKWARRAPPDPGQPTTRVLEQELARVRAQQRLLGSVLWWYLAPLGVGVVLFVAGASPSPWLTGAYAALVAAFFAWLWRLNRRAVRDELTPRARELETLLAGLVEAPEPGSAPR
jgi:hypothetical protein